MSVYKIASVVVGSKLYIHGVAVVSMVVSFGQQRM